MGKPKVTFVAGSQDFILEGIRFKVLLGGYTSRDTDKEGVVLLKPWPFVQDEIAALGDLGVRRMLEFGIYKGGSAVLWSLLLPLERYVGVDLQERELAFPEDVTTHQRWRAVRLFGGVSQADRAAVRGILATEFSRPLDLVVDDASHQHLLTKAAFETAFPHLRPGGIYLVEDWAWAHRPGPWRDPTHGWFNAPSLVNLIFELTLLSASRPDIIPRIVITPGFVAVHRGTAKLGEDFTIAGSTVDRGRPLQPI
jgi:SAM-dependent methyltransferase